MSTRATINLNENQNRIKFIDMLSWWKNHFYTYAKKHQLINKSQLAYGKLVNDDLLKQALNNKQSELRVRDKLSESQLDNIIADYLMSSDKMANPKNHELRLELIDVGTKLHYDLENLKIDKQQAKSSTKN